MRDVAMQANWNTLLEFGNKGANSTSPTVLNPLINYHAFSFVNLGSGSTIQDFLSNLLQVYFYVDFQNCWENLYVCLL